jgi:multidrug resistance efflux pump
VVAFRPSERQQQIQAPMEGVVESVPDALVEGAYVRKGDLLLRIEPFAADQNMQVERQIDSFEEKREATIRQLESYEEAIRQLQGARERVAEAADQAIASARAKKQQKEELISGYEEAESQTRNQLQRQLPLAEEGITAEYKIEILRSKWRKAEADLKAGERAVEQAKAELQEKIADREQKLQKAQSEIDIKKADAQKIAGTLQSIDKDISDLEQKLGSLQRGDIRAPTDGFIHRLPVFPQGHAVKKGENLLTFVPVTDDYAAELLISGNDMPLVEPGDHVRLQFEGWPAIQFSGWPDMAYGTFGGEVALVDPTDDGTGKFRIMVRPAPDEEWPSAERLRQGVRVNGWVMLREVSIIFEIWRQLNGFPPLPPESMQKDAGKDAKRPTVLK